MWRSLHFGVSQYFRVRTARLCLNRVKSKVVVSYQLGFTNGPGSCGFFECRRRRHCRIDLRFGLKNDIHMPSPNTYGRSIDEELSS